MSSFGVALKAAPNEVELRKVCLGFGRTCCRVGLFGGLGLGMYEVLRLSVRKSGGCCREGLGLCCAKRG